VFDGVAVRMYEPVKRSGVVSGIMYYHGGGFVVGSLSKYSLHAGHLLLSVAYLRKAVDYLHVCL